MPLQDPFARSGSSGTCNSTVGSRHPQRSPSRGRPRINMRDGTRRAPSLGYNEGYLRPAYAVTSNVTATSLNSGLIQIMRSPPLAEPAWLQPARTQPTDLNRRRSVSPSCPAMATENRRPEIRTRLEFPKVICRNPNQACTSAVGGPEKIESGSNFVPSRRAASPS